MDRKRLRTRRLTPIQEKSPKITMTTVTVPLPRNLLATRITNSVGRLSMTSTRRIRPLSTMPPAKPAMAPTIVPMNTPIAIAREADQERGARAVDDQQEHVTLEAAGLAHRVREAGRTPRLDDLVRLRDVREAERHQDGTDDRPDEQDGEHRETDQGQPVLAELPPGQLPLVEGLEADLVVLGLRRVRVHDHRLVLGQVGRREHSVGDRPQALLPDWLRHGRPQYLMRGSTTPYAMSASRFASTTRTDVTRSTPIRIG